MATNSAAITQELALIFLISPQKALMTISMASSHNETEVETSYLSYYSIKWGGLQDINKNFPQKEGGITPPFNYESLF